MAKHDTMGSLVSGHMPCLIQSVTGVWKFERGGESISHAHSLPGHLFHYIISGNYHITTNGREYEVQANDIIYYHEVEEVTSYFSSKPVEFYSVGFLAEYWPPLPLSMRVIRGDKGLKRVFSAAYDCFGHLEDFAQQARLYSYLYKLIELVEVKRGEVEPTVKGHWSLWWEVENRIIRNRRFHVSVDEMAEMVLVSRSTLNRVCQSATGLSPRQRLIQLRINHADALLRFSSLSVSQIAAQLGYPRVNEFSREYRKVTGRCPRETRRG